MHCISCEDVKYSVYCFASYLKQFRLVYVGNRMELSPEIQFYELFKRLNI